MSPLVLAALAACALLGCKDSKPSGGTTGSAGSAAEPVRAADAAVAVPDAAAAPPVAPDAAEAGSAAAGSGSGDGFTFTVNTPLESNTFDKLDHDMQIKFMRDFVVPQMKAEFQAFDAKEYAVFGCKTCHGKDFKARKYKMPSPDLPKLDFAKLEAGQQEPKMAKFMELHIKPDMAKILNLTPYDDKHPDGFGCLSCHEAAK
jgi:hypothetical protein